MNPGTLLYLKSSEEPVIVLKEATDAPMALVLVRRPCLGQNGTSYVEAEFFRFELETATEQDIRKIEDIRRRHQLTQLAAKEVPSQIDLFSDIPAGALRN